MAVINYYKTATGVFSSIVSDDIYNAVLSSAYWTGSQATFNLINQYESRIEYAWNALLGIIPFRQIYCTLLAPNVQGTAKVYNWFTDLIPVASIKYLDLTTTEVTVDETVRNSTDRRVKYKFNKLYGDADLRVSQWGGVGDSNILLSGASIQPFGVYKGQSINDNIANYIRLQIPLFNSDYSKGLTITVTVSKIDSIRMSVNISTMATTYILPNNVKYYGGKDLVPVRENDDPYINPNDPTGGISHTGGGTGTFSGISDSVEIPDTPTLTATKTGFIKLYNPTLGQLQNLASYMWNSSLFDISTWQKLFSDPMDAVLGLSIVPVAVPDGGTQAVTIGNHTTTVSMNVAGAQYITVDCGTLNVEEYWGSYLDYDPYTKAELYLPYCGTHAIAVDDIMGKAVHIVYHVDILSGACCAYIQCGESVLYQFIGQCSSSIPITGNDWTNVINGVLSIAGSVGTMVATGGMTAPLAVGGIASATVNSFKPNIEKSGAISGTGGMLAIQTPYLILTRPNIALPDEQNTFTGYPSYINVNLGSCNGYTEVEKINLQYVNGTESEINEIKSLLNSGVIF